MSPANSRITKTSKPCSEISLRNVDNDDNAGCNVAGRILQNKSKWPRKPKRAQRSGCSVGGKFAHLGPPTEPNKIASLVSQPSIVESGRAVPWLSIAAPPIS